MNASAQRTHLELGEAAGRGFLRRGLKGCVLRSSRGANSVAGGAK